MKRKVCKILRQLSIVEAHPVNKLNQACRIGSALLLALALSTNSVQAQSNMKVASKKALDSLVALGRAAHLKDSIALDAWSHKVTSRINGKFSEDQMNAFADSLRRTGVSKKGIRHKKDSLLHQRDAMLKEVRERQKAVQEGVSLRYEKWADNLRKKLNQDSVSISLPNGPLANLPEISGIPAPVPDVDFTKITPVPSLGMNDFSSLNYSPELASLGAIPSVTELSDLQKSLPQINDFKTDLPTKLKATDLNGALEKEVKQVVKVEDASKILSDADKLKKDNELLQASGQLKNPKEAISSKKREAINHFAGQQVALTGAMTQMAKLKRKYSSIGSLSEIKKNDWLPRNGLKGKPFRQRFRIGLHTGFRSRGDTLLLDFYPNVSYRLTGRLEAGLGAIYRVRINTSEVSLDQHNPVWGMATFAVIKTFKSIFVRLEVDGNSFPKPGAQDQQSYRDWRWSFHSGIQTNFKLGKQWTGNVQMLYNFDSSLKDGFPEKLAMRMGVQYKLKPKKK